MPFYPAVVHRQRALGVQEKEAWHLGWVTKHAGRCWLITAIQLATWADFIVAHDDVLAGDLAGTSFAAPRVSAPLLSYGKVSV